MKPMRATEAEQPEIYATVKREMPDIRRAVAKMVKLTARRAGCDERSFQGGSLAPMPSRLPPVRQDPARLAASGEPRTRVIRRRTKSTHLCW